MGRPGRAGRAVSARRSRRSLLAAVAALGPACAACAAPWAPAAPAAPAGTPGPVVGGRPVARLRLVIAREGLPALDAAVDQAVAATGAATATAVEAQSLEAFTAGGPAAGGPAATAHRLLAAVQAGTPPDAVLLLGRDAQVARLQAQGLVQDVSGLMRRLRARLGGTSRVNETLHVIAGRWFAVPWYQRLVGHWARLPLPLPLSGGAPDGVLSYDALRLTLAGRAPDDPGWGIGGADSADADAWCWGAIHAWGGGLADRKGERVNLDTPQTVAALEWLAATLAGARVHPQAGAWTDGEKNAAFGRGETAYTYTERALPGIDGAGPEVSYLRTLAGPVARPRAVGGGAAWLLPRGPAPEAAERFLEALLDAVQQRRLWGAGGRFALPGYLGGWDDPAIAGAPWAATAARFRAELDLDGDAFVSASGNGGPETGAAQAVGALRFGAGMLRAVLAGRPAAAAVAEAHARAVALYRDFGLPGA
ncbi:MAG TPA: hypothetical protein VNK05_16060 [Chloroflexota bacterium]|nr:hypothetical protein [Chloroflexota bacterium]